MTFRTRIPRDPLNPNMPKGYRSIPKLNRSRKHQPVSSYQQARNIAAAKATPRKTDGTKITE